MNTLPAPPRDETIRLLESIDNRLRNLNSTVTAVGVVFVIWMALKALFWLAVWSGLAEAIAA